MTTSTIGCAGFLIAWIALGFGLARGAERKLSEIPLPRPWRTLSCAIVVAALALLLGRDFTAIAGAVTCIALIAASGADYRTGYVFDAITLPAALLVLTLSIVMQTTALAAWGVAELVIPFGALVAFTRGRMLGFGDVKAMYAVGAAFGPLESLVAIFAACVSGIVTVALAGRLQRGAELRFGPHLAVGAVVALVAGAPIARYLGAT
jgi:leader peptidase (prepilin peptidase)/N-methyltransferase